MIYIKSFTNYEEFKQIFAVVEHGNGVKSRKNKILLAALKDKTLHDWWMQFADQHRRFYPTSGFKRVDLFHAQDMDGLKTFIHYCMDDVFAHYERENDVRAIDIHSISLGNKWSVRTSDLYLDSRHGLCEDGDTRSVRYKVQDGKIYKMKAGKFLRRCIDNTFLRDIFPEQVKVWICEEFAREWQSYAEGELSTDKFELHVDDNFEAIYDRYRCVGDFKSCMAGEEQYTFYRDAINANAAYLTNENGNIVARCIRYNHVEDKEGNVYRLAERQYATDGDDVLKQILVDKLIAAGEIDGYKRVGVDCHDNMNFLLNDGTSLRDTRLHIKCYLKRGDTLSYQDSFVYYNKDTHIAYNDSDCSYTDMLNETSRTFGGGNYSEYLDEYIDEDDSVWDEYYDDYTRYDRSCEAYYHGRTIYVDRDRAEENGDFHWSDHYGMLLCDGIAYYVDSEDDYYKDEDVVWLNYMGVYALIDNCVEDNHEVWRLEDDCKCNKAGEYIFCDYAEWSEELQDYVDTRALVEA